MLLFAIVLFTLSPTEMRPDTDGPPSLERLAAFAAVGAAFYLGYPKRHLGILILLFGIIGLLEVAQNYVPSRHGRLSDGLVKAFGALRGAAFAAFIARRTRVPLTGLSEKQSDDF